MVFSAVSKIHYGAEESQPLLCAALELYLPYSLPICLCVLGIHMLAVFASTGNAAQGA